ncbi:MAG TPA: alkaline phosphatase family protein [Candidatus Acidoferrales bacterium]|nr:alkaline phosphatase family protein [Candidatus Acidoferrales bacterium]
MSGRARFAAAIALLAVASCASSSTAIVPAPRVPSGRTAAAGRDGRASSPIRHVVIVIQENRSFDNLFATFPGADGATSGLGRNAGRIPLTPVTLTETFIPGHHYTDFLTDYDHGKMDGFDVAPMGDGYAAGTRAYEYVFPSEIAPYWTIAKRYALADHLFQTQGSGSFTAHQDLIAGGTQISSERALVDWPTIAPWGCDAPKGTRTPLVARDGRYLTPNGPFPCFSYATIRDALDAENVSWRYYTPEIESTGGALWNAFDAIRAVRYGAQWSTNVVSPETTVLADAKANRLAAVSWVVPDAANSDHPGFGSDTGPSWVAQVVNAIGRSNEWKSSAVIVLWDDWGGWYDNVPPPKGGDFGGFGFRVPMLVISPYVRPGRISHTPYEFASILRFVEDNWRLPHLTQNDARATSIADVFDFSLPPRKFEAISAKYSSRFFLHEKPSGKPVDEY